MLLYDRLIPSLSCAETQDTGSGFRIIPVDNMQLGNQSKK